MEYTFHTALLKIRNVERHCIIIPRKPSQIPCGIDMDLMEIGCIGHLDGPNNRCIFEFFSQEGFEKAKKYLIRYMWEEKGL